MDSFKTQFDSWLSELIGDYEVHLIPIDYSKGRISYSKPLYIDSTILMVIRPPVLLDYMTSRYIMKKDYSFDFFLYDTQTDLIFGHISELDIYDWRDDLIEHILLAEDRMNKSYCPMCEFWLLERENIYGHKFMGCSGFPECDFSCEIETVFD